MKDSPDDSFAVRLAQAADRLKQAEDVPATALGDDVAHGTKLLTLLRRLGCGPKTATRNMTMSTLPSFPLLADRYEVRGRLGRGGFAEVWLALDKVLGRLVALKTPPRDTAPALLARLSDAIHQDGRGLAGIEHPNIVHVHNLFESDGRPYLDLEYVAGGSLQSVLEHGALACDDALRYTAAVGDALLALHSAGFVHRDVKPDNVLWHSSSDRVLLTDFGLAVRAGAAVSPAGTPLYMAPEAFDGGAEPPVDVYSLAATLFALLTGAPPFPGKTPADVLRAARGGLAARDQRLERVPSDLRDLLRAGLANLPPERPALSELVACCQQWSLGHSGQPRQDAEQTLELTVQRWHDDAWQPVAGDAAATRDLVVPEYGLVTGDRVRIEVTAARDGYLVLFNLGSTGNLHLLYPRGKPAWAEVNAGKPVSVAGIEVRPPAGCERIFALWCREPRALEQAELPELVDAALRQPPPMRTRDLVHMQASLRDLPPTDWAALLVELTHGDP